MRKASFKDCGRAVSQVYSYVMKFFTLYISALTLKYSHRRRKVMEEGSTHIQDGVTLVVVYQQVWRIGFKLGTYEAWYLILPGHLLHIWHGTNPFTFYFLFFRHWNRHIFPKQCLVIQRKQQIAFYILDSCYFKLPIFLFGRHGAFKVLWLYCEALSVYVNLWRTVNIVNLLLVFFVHTIKCVMVHLSWSSMGL